MENKVATKKCTKCGRVLPLTEYYKVYGQKSDQLRGDCKECRKEYSAKYQKEHREQVNEYARKYNKQHREEINFKARKRYAKNKNNRTIEDGAIKNNDNKNYDEFDKAMSNFFEYFGNCCVYDFGADNKNENENDNEKGGSLEITVYDLLPETQENVLYRCKKCGKLHYGIANKVIENNFICEECQKYIQEQKQIKRNKFWNFIAKLFHK